MVGFQKFDEIINKKLKIQDSKGFPKKCIFQSLYNTNKRPTEVSMKVEGLPSFHSVHAEPVFYIHIEFPLLLVRGTGRQATAVQRFSEVTHSKGFLVFLRDMK